MKENKYIIDFKKALILMLVFSLVISSSFIVGASSQSEFDKLDYLIEMFETAENETFRIPLETEQKFEVHRDVIGDDGSGLLMGPFIRQRFLNDFNNNIIPLNTSKDNFALDSIELVGDNYGNITVIVPISSVEHNMLSQLSVIYSPELEIIHLKEVHFVDSGTGYFKTIIFYNGYLISEEVLDVEFIDHETFETELLELYYLIQNDQIDGLLCFLRNVALNNAVATMIWSACNIACIVSKGALCFRCANGWTAMVNNVVVAMRICRGR